jgi:hypothetical protein
LIGLPLLVRERLESHLFPGLVGERLVSHLFPGLSDERLESHWFATQRSKPTRGRVV